MQNEVKSMKWKSATADYKRIETIILFLEKNFQKKPDLKQIAHTVNLSEYHLHRLFRRWAGITPKHFLQLLNLEHAKQLMKNPGSLLDVTNNSGLSSAGRLHDLFVTIEAMTPDEFRNHGRHLKISYGFFPSPFGTCFAAVTGRGICRLAFIEQDNEQKMVRVFKKEWYQADVRENTSVVKPFVDRIFGPSYPSSPLPLHLKGTNFQVKVWQALLGIPADRLASYEQIAQGIGRPKAVRAAANAVAHNPVAFLIPCHRVIRKTGALGGYRWGLARKKAILAWEAGIRQNE